MDAFGFVDKPAVQVGDRYKQRGSTLRVLAVQNGYVLLEDWVKDRLAQYIVTHSLHLLNGELVWSGSGAYYPCIDKDYDCDQPFVALRKAIKYMYTCVCCEGDADEALHETLSLDVHNGSILTLSQLTHDAPIHMQILSKENVDHDHMISAADMAMLMNYYVACKDGRESSDYIVP